MWWCWGGAQENPLRRTLQKLRPAAPRSLSGGRGAGAGREGTLKAAPGRTSSGSLGGLSRAFSASGSSLCRGAEEDAQPDLSAAPRHSRVMPRSGPAARICSQTQQARRIASSAGRQAAAHAPAAAAAATAQCYSAGGHLYLPARMDLSGFADPAVTRRCGGAAAPRRPRRATASAGSCPPAPPPPPCATATPSTAHRRPLSLRTSPAPSGQLQR